MKKLLKLIPFLVFAAITLYIFPHYDNHFAYYFEVGKPWGYQLLTASSDFPVYKTETQLQEEQNLLLADFAPCFTPCSDTLSPLVLSYEERQALVTENYNFICVIENQVARRYPLSEVYTPKTAFETFNEVLAPNITFDSVATAQLKTSLLSTISLTQGVVQTGEKIIDTGEIVTESDYQILMSLKKAYEEDNVPAQQRIWAIVGIALLICFIVGVLVAYLYYSSPVLLEKWTTVFFVCILPLILIAITFITLRYAPIPLYLIPFAWIPIVVRAFYDARTAMIVHLVTILICALAVPVPLEFLLIQSLVGAIALVSMQDLSRRSQVAKTAGWIVLTYALGYTAFCLISPDNIRAIDWHTYLYILVNGILVICGSYGLILLFERLFGLISATMLIELTNINSSVLQAFAQKAPGSFQHSLQVGNLASEAAKKIGANALLVRTGALYHDIGKMLHPEYFVENQNGGENPLLNMAPEEAARIVMQHVPDGIEIAKKAHLPSVISRFIETHHGTSRTRYFYNTYVNAHPSETVDESLFRYSGRRPTTKEGAILMMADAVEARSRSLTDYTEENLWEMIVDMTDQQVADKQFSQTPLSFKDLEDIRLVFKECLVSIYHHRIHYPAINSKL